MGLLTSTEKESQIQTADISQDISGDALDEKTKYGQNCHSLPPDIASSSPENPCLDNHAFYLVIIVGLVFSNCILSCLTVQKR